MHLAAHAGDKYNELRKAMLGRIFTELDLDDFGNQTKAIEGKEHDEEDDTVKEEEGERALAERWDQVFVMGDMK